MNQYQYQYQYQYSASEVFTWDEYAHLLEIDGKRLLVPVCPVSNQKVGFVTGLGGSSGFRLMWHSTFMYCRPNIHAPGGAFSKFWQVFDSFVFVLNMLNVEKSKQESCLFYKTRFSAFQTWSTTRWFSDSHSLSRRLLDLVSKTSEIVELKFE